MLTLRSVLIISVVAALAAVQLPGKSFGAREGSPAGVAAAPPGSPVAVSPSDEGIIRKGELLTLQRAVAIAAMRQPNIIAAQSTIAVNESRVGQAKSNYYPQISASSGYSRIKPVAPATTRSTTVVGSAVDSFTGSVALTQNIYDFGRTSALVDIQKLNTNASRSDLENTAEQIVLNVKQAYYSVLQASRNRAVAEESVKQFQQHLEQARGFYEVGTKSRFDVTKAEVDLSNAQLNLIRADNTLKTTRVNLNNAMGVPDAPEYTLEDTLAFRKYDITFDEAVARAFNNRPDIQAIVTRRRAAEENINLANRNYYPTLTGTAAYNWGGAKFPLGEGWTVGALVNLPIFSGFLTKSQVSEAKANLNVVRANEDLLRQNVLLDVQQAYLNLKEAENRIPTAELAVKQATENLDIANGRYAAGVGNPLEVTDAQVGYSNAKITYTQALSDYKVAQAALEKAMGVRQ